MSYLSDWIEAEEQALAAIAPYPGCLAGTMKSLRCTAPKHNPFCNRSRFERGFGVWCREPTEEGMCVRLKDHEGDHEGIER